MVLTDDAVTSFNTARWVVALTLPYLVMAIVHLPEWVKYRAHAWSVLCLVGAISGAIAGVGVNFAYIAYAPLDGYWVGLVVCALLQPLVLSLWPIGAAPGKPAAKQWPAILGLFLSLGLVVATFALLIEVVLDGTVANYTPMYLYLPLLAWSAVAFVVLVLEAAGKIKIMSGAALLGSNAKELKSAAKLLVTA
jgi:hypothetical protein